MCGGLWVGLLEDFIMGAWLEGLWVLCDDGDGNWRFVCKLRIVSCIYSHFVCRLVSEWKLGKL